ncbi:MAG: hypothetical protein ABIK83_15135 [Candidatus Zixiibacteriota bacterium]
MKKFLICIVMLLSCIPRDNATAGHLDTSGFFDVVANYNRDTRDGVGVGLGQLEVALERGLSDEVSVAVAIAYNDEDESFDLGSAEIGVDLYRNPHAFISSLGLVAGRFDVPFGIDCRCYGSMDRKLVTAPVVVERTHNFWSEEGFAVRVRFGAGSLVVFGVDGFGTDAHTSEEDDSIPAADNDTSETVTISAVAFGGRLGIDVGTWLELGTSFASGRSDSYDDDMQRLGFDLQFSVKDFDLIGEYIYDSHTKPDAEIINKGYYVQALQSIRRVFIVGRYGAVRTASSGSIEQVSVGAGYSLVEGVEVRLELLHDSENETVGGKLQVVAGF